MSKYLAKRSLLKNRLALDVENLLADLIKTHAEDLAKGGYPQYKALETMAKRVNAFWKAKHDEIQEVDRVFGVHKQVWAAQIASIMFDVIASALVLKHEELQKIPAMTSIFYGGGLASGLLGALVRASKEKQREPKRLLRKTDLSLLVPHPTKREVEENKMLLEAVENKLRESAENRNAYVSLLEQKLTRTKYSKK